MVAGLPPFVTPGRPPSTVHDNLLILLKNNLIPGRSAWLVSCMCLSAEWSLFPGRGRNQEKHGAQVNASARQVQRSSAYPNLLPLGNPYLSFHKQRLCRMHRKEESLNPSTMIGTSADPGRSRGPERGSMYRKEEENKNGKESS